MSAEVRIDFHSNVPDKLQYSCRLVRKARAQASPARIVLLAQNPQQLAELDEAMWSFSDIDFLPHVQINHPLAAQTPVLLTCQEVDEVAQPTILINLSNNTLTHPQAYVRVFEIVGSDESDKLAGRERYRVYQQLGYTLSHFVANMQ